MSTLRVNTINDLSDNPFSGGISAGTVIAVASVNVPAGYIPADGASLNTYAYRGLHSVLSNIFGGTAYSAGVTDQPNATTTFTLPDLRGEFIRGWDNGRGVDSGRTFGSSQGFAMQNVTGQVTTSADGNAGYFTGRSGVFTLSGCNTRIVAAGGAVSASYCRYLNFSLTDGGASTATETRPRNVALLACIKY